jgi:choline dehydrogenase-like flavoprotein
MLEQLSAEFTAKPRYDVCIVGTGAAGITLALILAKSGHGVFLAEAGGLGFSDESQEFFRGEVEGDDYFELSTARLRCLGGTTNHWGGQCRALGEVDFTAKAGFPLTQWPIRKSDVDPFLPETRKILELEEFPPDMPLDENISRVHFRYSPPVRFGEKYLEDLRSSVAIDACYDCMATDIDFADGRVSNMQFRNIGGSSIRIEADVFVLACGGIENSRLLLAWNRRYNNAVGNERDLVGRYWMDHPTNTVGAVAFCSDFALPDDDVDRPISRQRLYVAPTPKFMAEREILNCEVRLDRIPAMECRPPSWIARLLGRRSSDEVSMAWIRTSAEQEPVFDNRIALGDEADRFGIPRPVLHWRRSETDKRTIRETLIATGEYLAAKTPARLRVDDWVLDKAPVFSCEGGGFCPGGYHHMGGTRMASSPVTGVVDAHCKVFGTKNLYCAGSSVFPSGGYANPTTTIVQLSLRLGQHLIKSL